MTESAIQAWLPPRSVRRRPSAYVERWVHEAAAVRVEKLPSGERGEPPVDREFKVQCAGTTYGPLEADTACRTAGKLGPDAVVWHWTWDMDCWCALVGEFPRHDPLYTGREYQVVRNAQDWNRAHLTYAEAMTILAADPPVPEEEGDHPPRPHGGRVLWRWSDFVGEWIPLHDIADRLATWAARHEDVLCDLADPPITAAEGVVIELRKT